MRPLLVVLSLLVVAWVIATPASAEVSCVNWNTREFFERAGVEDISRCLNTGSKVTAKNKSGWTPLHIAAGWNKTPAVVTFLIKAGANLNAQDEFGLTPLHWATAFGKNPAVLTALLDAGANPLMGNLAGEIPWDYVKTNPALKGAKLHKQLAQISCNAWNKKSFFEIANLADISRCLKTDNPNARDEKGRTPLHYIAMFNKTAQAVKALVNAGARVNARDEKGRTPLHRAVVHGKSPAVVTALLEAGARVNAKDVAGWTPLHYAAQRDKTPSVIKILLKAGAEVNERNKGGWTPLHLAVGGVRAREIYMAHFLAPFEAKIASLKAATVALIAALKKGHSHIAAQHRRKLVGLEAELADIRAGIAALQEGHWAEAVGHRRKLVHTTQVEKAQKKALLKKVWEKTSGSYPAVVSVLLQAGAKIDAKTRNGVTPLHQAAGYGIPKIVASLLDAGANPTIKDKKGQTPWDYAKENPDLKGTDIYWRLNEARFK